MIDSRRAFLKRAGAAATVVSLAGAANGAEPATSGAESPAPAPAPRGNPIAVSTYSFWRFKDDSKLSIEKCIDESARMGFDAVEILHIQMGNEDAAYLQRLKQQA